MPIMRTSDPSLRCFPIRLHDSIVGEDRPLADKYNRLIRHPYALDFDCDLTLCSSSEPGAEYSMQLQPQAVQITDILHSGPHSTVYLGRYRCDDDQELEIALKFADNEKIPREAVAYSCQWAYIFNEHLNEEEFSGIDTQCLRLYKLGTEMRFWEHGKIRPDTGMFVRKVETPNIPPQHIIYRLGNISLNIGGSTATKRDYPLCLAVRFYQEVQRLLDKVAFQEIFEKKHFILFRLHMHGVPFTPMRIPNYEGSWTSDTERIARGPVICQYSSDRIYSSLHVVKDTIPNLPSQHIIDRIAESIVLNVDVHQLLETIEFEAIFEARDLIMFRLHKEWHLKQCVPVMPSHCDILANKLLRKQDFTPTVLPGYEGQWVYDTEEGFDAFLKKLLEDKDLGFNILLSETLVWL
ncbi:hypothetical protein EUX98_g1535 [Antrodiella citrinella]|uniref:Uncharacterized protein n=1 Tax=Antrodiella citrinella TaxID=2447956 RepID=A0A4S4N477_9APHY|nr:hypothetical protein EUX98_g1535 [Antrodiella citrinella]